MEKTNSSEKLNLLDFAHSPSAASSGGESKGQASGATRSNGWIESVVFRKGKTFTMSLQRETMSHPIFVGEKQSGDTYVVRRTGEVLGFLSKIPKKGETVGYKLETCKKESDTPEESMILQYHVPSIVQSVMEAPPRRATVSVSGKMTVATKEPYYKSGGRRGLDFNKRGRIPSRKNMQLQDQDGKVVLQMVKWDKDQFHLDFE